MDEEEWEEEEDADKLFIDDSDDGKQDFKCRLLFYAYCIFLGCYYEVVIHFFVFFFISVVLMMQNEQDNQQQFI